jgi:hypothetical protein
MRPKSSFSRKEPEGRKLDEPNFLERSEHRFVFDDGYAGLRRPGKFDQTSRSRSRGYRSIAGEGATKEWRDSAGKRDENTKGDWICLPMTEDHAWTKDDEAWKTDICEIAFSLRLYAEVKGTGVDPCSERGDNAEGPYSSVSAGMPDIHDEVVIDPVKFFPRARSGHRRTEAAEREVRWRDFQRRGDRIDRGQVGKVKHDFRRSGFCGCSASEDMDFRNRRVSF